MRQPCERCDTLHGAWLSRGCAMHVPGAYTMARMPAAWRAAAAYASDRTPRPVRQASHSKYSHRVSTARVSMAIVSSESSSACRLKSAMAIATVALLTRSSTAWLHVGLQAGERVDHAAVRAGEGKVECRVGGGATQQRHPLGAARLTRRYLVCYRPDCRCGSSYLVYCIFRRSVAAR